jgi:hypothetical protein
METERILKSRFAADPEPPTSTRSPAILSRVGGIFLLEQIMFMALEPTGTPSAETDPQPEISTNSTISPPPPNFELEAAVYPPDSLISRYVDYARQRVESADSYIVGAVLPVVAACLARNVYFPWGDGNVYPNIFSLLAGRAGERKSSALDLAENFAKAALPAESFLPPNCSSESLMDEYDTASGGWPDKLLLLDDANPLLGSWMETGYGRRVGQQFLRLHDCKGFSETFQKNKSDENTGGRRNVDQTSTSVALGATPDICRLNGRGISSGLQRRFLYYVAKRHGRFIASPPPRDPEQLEDLTRQFRELTNLEVECSFRGPALRIWEDYQRDNRELLRQADTEAASSRLNGAPRAVQKIAMIFEASCWVRVGECKWKGGIREKTLELAIKHVDGCLKTAEMLDQLGDRDATTVAAESLLARIRQDFGGRQPSGPIVLTKSDLTAKYAPHSNRPHAWSPSDIYQRFIPVLIGKGMARLGGKNGKKVSYEFAPEDVENFADLPNAS